MLQFLTAKEFVQTKNLFVFFILEKNILNDAYFSYMNQKHNFSDSKVKLNHKIQVKFEKKYLSNNLFNGKFPFAFSNFQSKATCFRTLLRNHSFR